MGVDPNAFRVAPAWSLGILAGGQSQRMGTDKAALLLNGVTFIRFLANRLAPAGVKVMIATRADGPGHEPGFAVVHDQFPLTGPLAGMLTLLEAAETPFVLVAACDTPFLPPDLGDRLLHHATGVSAVLLSLEGQLEPLPVLLSTDLAPTLRRLVESGERRALAYWDEVPCAVVPFEGLYPGEEARLVLMNVNTPTLLTEARKRIQKD